MKSALLVAILAAVLLVVAPAARAADYSFNGNVTVSDPDGTLKFRFTTTVARPQAAAFLSLLAQVNHNDDGTEVKVDTLAGWVAWKRFPAGLLSYFDASLDLQSPGDFQAEASKNLMAKAYYAIDEIDADDNIVHRHLLNETADALGKWSGSIGSTANGNLRWVETSASFAARGDAENGKFKVKTTWFLSSVVGKVDYADTVLTPRVVEAVIRIANYPYANPANRLVLHLAVAHGKSSFSASGAVLQTGNNLEKVSVKLAGDCRIVADEDALNGETRSVTVSAWNDADVTANDVVVRDTDLHAQLNAKFKSSWAVSRIHVVFPANASHIVYDPSLSAGTTYQRQSGSASSVFPSLLALVLAALIGVYLL